MNIAVKTGDSVQILAVGEVLFLAVALLTFQQMPMLSLASAMVFFVLNAAFFYVKAITHCEKNGRIVNSITAFSSLAVPFVFTVFFVMRVLA